ncbi:hypothetical protein [Paraburkholderia tropica]|uniref:hypothetical protein n=1 Tax=Paraburkholderia tropica TaxID=92647 RepID=UPI003D28A831
MLEEEYEIRRWLEENNVEQFRLEKIGAGIVVHAQSHVIIRSPALKKLPVQFGVVEGNFYIKAPLQTLVGAPRGVKGSFTVDTLGVSLKSLIGAPTIVGDDFVCCDAKLKSLEGSPKLVMGSFVAANNLLMGLKHAPRTVGQDFDVSANPIHSLTGFNCEIAGNFIHTCHGGHRIDEVSSRYGLDQHTADFNRVKLPGDLIPHLIEQFYLEKLAHHRFCSMKPMRSRNVVRLLNEA